MSPGHQKITEIYARQTNHRRRRRSSVSCPNLPFMEMITYTTVQWSDWTCTRTPVLEHESLARQMVRRECVGKDLDEDQGRDCSGGKTLKNCKHNVGRQYNANHLRNKLRVSSDTCHSMCQKRCQHKQKAHRYCEQLVTSNQHEHHARQYLFASIISVPYIVYRAILRQLARILRASSSSPRNYSRNHYMCTT